MDFEDTWVKDRLADGERFGMIWAFLVNRAYQRRACP
jgi:hypothetical protein